MCMFGSHRTALSLIAAALMVLPSGQRASGLDLSSLLSPRNRERPRRASTLYIILHTTEGPEQASLNKVRQNGECHYFLTTAGKCYRIVDPSRVAYHAGRSMWNGRKDIDSYSIGIECSGYYYRSLTSAQSRALAELIAQLQKTYNIADERVMPHCMVAYGSPNRWHRRSHRGRKRCGAFFADPAVRAKLGLTSRPAYDPDVRAGRLVVADPWLANRLYGGSPVKPRPAAPAAAPAPATPREFDLVIRPGQSVWDVARDRYRSPDTLYILPSGLRVRGSEVSDWSEIPQGTRVVLSGGGSENAVDGVKQVTREGVSAFDLARDEFAAPSTFYLLPDGQVRRGGTLNTAELRELPRGTRVLLGYAAGGAITAQRTAFDICGTRWNDPSTIYWTPNAKVATGSEVSENAIPARAQIFFRN